MRRTTRPTRIGEALIASGELSEDQLRAALEEQRRSGRKLGEVLVGEGIVSPDSVVRALAQAQGVRGVRLRHGLIDPELLDLLGREEAERLRCIPLFRLRDELTVAMADPSSLPAVDRIAELTSLRVRPVLALESDISDFIRKYASGQTEVDEFLTTLTESDLSVIEREGVDENAPPDLQNMVDGSPIVNLVNMAVLTAIRRGASDVHFEPSEKGTRIRCRVDGVLRDLMTPPPGVHSAVVSRVKVIGKMDIAQKRLPQEGRVRIVAEGRPIDLRVSSMPTLLGEKIVMRILDKSSLEQRMDRLGFEPEALERFTRSLRQPHGLVLVTGPTGSGKTTTLYSALDLLRSPEVNVVTVEDPVEYQLDLINQIQVNEQIGMTFPRALRSILRQDPDIIMIGEIRDQETARVAAQAALTGHVVLATLHTNDTASAVARLRDMELEAYLIASGLNCVVAQRLARTICPGCRVNYYPSEEALEEAGLPLNDPKPLRRGEGCARCHDSGFEGRCGVYEVFEVTAPLRRLIYADADAETLRAQHTRDGGVSLREAAVRIALDGRTSLEEALRVTRKDRADEAAEAEPPTTPEAHTTPDVHEEAA